MRCPSCKHYSSKMELYERPNSKRGLAEKLYLKCTHCKKNQSTFYSSEENLNDNAKSSSFDVNVKSVYASLATGLGLAGLKSFLANMDLPAPISEQPYQRTMKYLNEKSVKQAEELMCAAAQRLIKIVKFEEPDMIEIGPTEEEVAKVVVTIDGTWQRRGHCSKIGVIFVISIRTGEVLDYIIKSLFCHTCQKHSKDDTNTEKYKHWYESHKNVCTINHVGSSGDMEASGACEMFLRSVESRSLKYTTLVGDGDTGTFAKVKAQCLSAFGQSYLIMKEECVGHIQKRMGSALRKYKQKKSGMKLSDGKSVGGAGRLKDVVCDKMQNYFGEAIKNNVGDVEGMRNAIWAIYYHMIKDDSKSLEEQHKYCPKTQNSWCLYHSNREIYTENTRLPSVFLTELKNIFEHLTDSDILERCRRGFTQNQNECINGVLWSKCPKTKFCGKVRVSLAVSKTVSHFNTGAGHRAALFSSISNVPSRNTFLALRKEDSCRIKFAAKKILEKARIRRRKLRSLKKSKKDGQKLGYKTGSFGVSDKPEDITVPKKIKQQKIQTSSADTDIEITFVNEKDVIMIGNYN